MLIPLQCTFKKHQAFNLVSVCGSLPSWSLLETSIRGGESPQKALSVYHFIMMVNCAHCLEFSLFTNKAQNRRLCSQKHSFSFPGCQGHDVNNKRSALFAPYTHFAYPAGVYSVKYIYKFDRTFNIRCLDCSSSGQCKDMLRVSVHGKRVSRCRLLILPQLCCHDSLFSLKLYP